MSARALVVLVLLLAACHGGAASSTSNGAASSTSGGGASSSGTGTSTTSGGGASSTSGSSGTSGASTDGGPGSTDGGASVFNDVPRDGTWTFVPFADAVCADGTPTGIAVSFTSASNDLVIYLNGGGACWDAATCQSQAPVCATNLDTGWDQTHGTPAWSSFSSGFAGLFDRGDPNNPVKDFNYVDVGYCTGDLHAGDHIASYTVTGRDGQPHPVHHMGMANLKAYLAALVAAFPNAQRVVLAGSSAGGFGTFLTYDTVATAFAPVPVYMVDDSGPVLENAFTPEPGPELEAANWDLASTLPTDCTVCVSADGGLPELAQLATYLSQKYPDGRMALLSSLHDGTISQRYDLDGGAYAQALRSLGTDVLQPLPNWRVFAVAGNTHGMLMKGPLDQTTTCGVGVTSYSGSACPTLEAFLQEEIDGTSSSWTSRVPPSGAPGRIDTFPDNSACNLTH